MLAELYAGVKRIQTVFRGAQDGALINSDGYSRYSEGTRCGEMFTLTLPAITTGVAAGNVAGAAAAASTQFGLINPANSGKNLELVKFGMGVISGVPGAGPLFHGFITNMASLTATSPGGTVRSNILGGSGNTVAIPWALAAGAALTGSTQAPTVQRVADFSSTNTAQATADGHVRTIEEVAGEIILPPGVMWLPLWGAAGTTLLCGYSIVWQEVPI